jgi:hypothetical protein
MDINRIINIIRSLKEDAPTMSLGTPPTGKIAGTVQAGDEPPVNTRKKYIYGKGFRKNWLQKRNPPQ